MGNPLHNVVYATCGYYHAGSLTHAHVLTFGIYTNKKDAEVLMGKLLNYPEVNVKESDHSDSYLSRVGVFWVKELHIDAAFNTPMDMGVPDAKKT